MGTHLRRIVLVGLMILAALVAPVAVPIRIVVLHLRRDTARIEFVVPRVAPGEAVPPETA